MWNHVGGKLRSGLSRIITPDSEAVTEPYQLDRAVALEHAEHAAGGEPHVRLTAFVHGTVQGVGFRWWTRSQALELGLVGSARNHADGRVVVVAEGTPGTCVELLDRLSKKPSEHYRPGHVTTVVPQWQRARGVTGFDMG